MTVPLNAIFLDKDLDERCKIFLDSMDAKNANLESEQFSTNNSLKVLENILEQTLKRWII